MKSIVQKGIIPARTQSQDKKFQTSRPCEVVRSGQAGQVRSGQVRSGQVRSGQVMSGQVRSGHVRSGQVRSGQVRSGQVTTFAVSAVFSLSFQAVVLLTKTAINHWFFSIKSVVCGWI